MVLGKTVQNSLVPEVARYAVEEGSKLDNVLCYGAICDSCKVKSSKTTGVDNPLLQNIPGYIECGP